MTLAPVKPKPQAVLKPKVPRTLVRLLARLTAARADDDIDTDEWEDAFMQTLAQYHLAAYAHGAGIPLQKLTPEDHALVQAVIDAQKEFLKGYAQAWLEGRYNDREVAAQHRSDMYADATLGTWWMGHTRGWPLPSWPADGTTQCKTKCRCGWDIQELPGEGNADARWVLGPADHCQTCLQRSEEWNPVQIRNGELQLDGVTTKGWVTFHGHHILLGGSEGGGSGAGGGSQGWKPSMTLSEATYWSKDSELKGPLYHFTSQSAASNIAKEGFDASHGKTNQYYGQGVYLAPQKNGLAFYGDTSVETRVNVRKVYEYPDTNDLPLTHSKSPLGPDIDALRARDPTLSRATAVRQILQAKGYDAVSAIEDGQPILVVFDKTRITVVNDVQTD